MSRLKKKYTEEVRPKLQEQFSYTNTMLVPRLLKVVISMGVSEATKDRNAIQDAASELALLAGQRPVLTKARVSISNFKLREGQQIGAMVTLRGTRMYDFVDRFVNISAPRIRDFRGFPTKCDGRGNYSYGLQSQDMFPEVDLDNIKRTQGMNITFVTTAATDEECLAMLGYFGMPFTK